MATNTTVKGSKIRQANRDRFLAVFDAMASLESTLGEFQKRRNNITRRAWVIAALKFAQIVDGESGAAAAVIAALGTDK